MSHCDQNTITDAAFVHLRGIHTLNMDFCHQATITDAICANLRGITYLEADGCSLAVRAFARALLPQAPGL